MNNKNRVFVVHWWNGREYKKPEEMPASLHEEIEKAKECGTRYLTYAMTKLETGEELFAVSRCMPKDAPRRRFGHNRAVGLLTRDLLGRGYRVAGESVIPK